MTQYELDTLELGHMCQRHKQDSFLRVAENEEQCEIILSLSERELVKIREMAGANKVMAYRLEPTEKGHQAMYARWKMQKN